MTRTQIAFRLDAEKASQFKQQAELEGKNLNTVLERLVDAYLAGSLTDASSDLLIGRGSSDRAHIEETVDSLSKKVQGLTAALDSLSKSITHRN